MTEVDHIVELAHGDDTGAAVNGQIRADISLHPLPSMVFLTEGREFGACSPTMIDPNVLSS